MRRKGLIMLGLVALMSLASTFSSLAGEWKQDAKGWCYQNADSSYLSNGWYWIDGKCYYFNSNGYCLLNTKTPDGYDVDASGAWIVNGVVQTRDTEVRLNTISVQIPNGYNVEYVDRGIILTETNGYGSSIMVCEDVDSSYIELAQKGEAGYISHTKELAENHINRTIKNTNSNISIESQSKSVVNNRTWYNRNYVFSFDNSFILIVRKYYVNYSGDSCIVIVLEGETREILDIEDLVKNYIK